MKKTVLLPLFGFALVVALSLTACSSKLTNENLTKVKTGMSASEVEALLGKPASIETSETLGIRATTYYYKAGGAEVKISFLNDGVMVKEGSFK
ncbi:Outer membrane protein assembly factor BamE, lipoprotein component of the BamABCDE complex [Verrucomicrobium sp. GAS474]|uniref:outer membrane protein assembly factor BamE domain-containing protein n=1 Tax=Verrucomicrobium sp. GAS474 TaxID=1882831 RepID=UPI00087951F9|nr:outer membrane protein assembly factor BamE [Verrucomicrobium sp. GAS474]SDU14671.1 Outer membrane protein assembly factor BamE, lipoprotein component of the BamABCDE complex [Verrucomicrobium sp. GAS474]